MVPELIYCASGNARFAQIAIDAGFIYGAQLPGTVYHPVDFADQAWKRPNRDGYMAALMQHKPRMATVLDLERQEQLLEVLGWAEDAARFVEVVIIIPKVFGIVPEIPTAIGGKSVRLAYSVPTKYGGSELPLWEFGRRLVHLLGGSPQAQMKLARYLNVASVDGNMANKVALQHNRFWVPGTARYASNRYWPRLDEADNQAWNGDAPYEAFRRSCENVMRAWHGT